MEFYGIWKRRGIVRVTPIVLAHSHPSCNHWEPAGDPEVFPNLITDAGNNLLARAVESNNIDTPITYVALGDVNTAVSASDTSLPGGGEFFRKQVTAYDVSGAQATTTVYIAPGEANQNIYNIGWFAEDATATLDTGTMVAAVDYARLPKVNTEAIQIDRVDTFA